MYSLKQNGKLLKLWIYINYRRNTKNSWPLFSRKSSASTDMMGISTLSIPFLDFIAVMSCWHVQERYSIVIGSRQSINWSGYNSLSAPLTKSESLRVTVFLHLQEPQCHGNPLTNCLTKPTVPFWMHCLTNNWECSERGQKRKRWAKSKQTQRISGIWEKMSFSEPGISTPVGLKSLQRTTNTQLSN